MKDLYGRLSTDLQLNRSQVERTAALFDADNTLPFIARYRKEITGNLDEATLAEFRDKLNELRKLDTRQKAIINSIQEQGQLTPELEEAIEEASKPNDVLFHQKLSSKSSKVPLTDIAR